MLYVDRNCTFQMRSVIAIDRNTLFNLPNQYAQIAHGNCIFIIVINCYNSMCNYFWNYNVGFKCAALLLMRSTIDRYYVFLWCQLYWILQSVTNWSKFNWKTLSVLLMYYFDRLESFIFLSQALKCGRVINILFFEKTKLQRRTCVIGPEFAPK